MARRSGSHLLGTQAALGDRHRPLRVAEQIEGRLAGSVGEACRLCRGPARDGGAARSEILRTSPLGSVATQGRQGVAHGGEPRAGLAQGVPVPSEIGEEHAAAVEIAALEEIDAEIRSLEEDIQRLLRDVTT